MELPINKISTRPDARALNADAINGLVDSIAEIGLINPIRVRPAGDGWEVIAGVHRLEACKILGLTEIAADVVDADDVHAELAMIDENLCRAELSPSDRARHTARRKVIYEGMHPQTVQGANAGGPSGKFVHTETDSFAAATAKATGKDERTVRRDAERGDKILPEVLELIRNTDLDTGSYLDKLKQMPGSQQFAAASRDVGILRAKERDQNAKARHTKIGADVKARAAREVGAIIMEHVPNEWIEGTIANLYAAGAANIANELKK